jgi:hypothetical protein
MEIRSDVLKGTLEHRDSSGGGGVIRPGEIQLMRASATIQGRRRSGWIGPSSR